MPKLQVQPHRPVYPTPAALVTCADEDACTLDQCDPEVGCVFPPKCDDGDACSADNCEPTTGECFHVKIPGFGSCSTDVDCDDEKLCTIDVCGTQQICLHTQDPCDDVNHCTIDWCEEGTGCQHQPKDGCTVCEADVDCDDGDACTADTCEVDGSCQHDPLDCDDDNACTNDFCGLEQGCYHTLKGDGIACPLDEQTTGKCCNGVCLDASAPCE